MRKPRRTKLINCCERDYDHELGVLASCVFVGDQEFENPKELTQLILKLEKAKKWLANQKKLEKK